MKDVSTFIYHSNKTQERKVQANYWNRNDICLKVLLRDYVRHFCANIYYPLFDPIYFSSSYKEIKAKEDNLNSASRGCNQELRRFAEQRSFRTVYFL